MRVVLFLLSFGVFAQSMSFDDWEKQILEPMLYGGRPADIQKNELSHVFWLGFCSFTAVSDEVIFGAAHCLSENQVVSFKDRKGKTYRARCNNHPRYDDNRMTNNDFALCKLTEKLPEDQVVASISKQIYQPGQKVLIAGYGRPNIGVLHLGESIIRSTGNQDYTTRTPVALGSGDSAGPMFLAPLDLVKGPFVQIAVNSRRSTTDTTSYYNITGLERSWKWFEQWAERNSAKVCGINASCDIPKPIPRNCLPEVEIVEYFKSETKLAEKALEACMK